MVNLGIRISIRRKGRKRAAQILKGIIVRRTCGTAHIIWHIKRIKTH